VFNTKKQSGGVMPMIVATIEAQGKFVQETMKTICLF
jgi:hypothetical protein